VESSEISQLNNYLHKVENLLGYLVVEDRQKIVAEVKHFLLSEVEQQQLSLEQILKRYKDRVVVINLALAKHGMPLLEQESKKWWKIILMAFISLVLIAILSISLVVKSYLPLVNVNDIDGTLELFGRHLILEKDDVDFFQKINDKSFMQWKTKSQITKGTFDFKNMQWPLWIQLQAGELAIRSTDKSEMRYTCYTAQMVQQVFTQQQNHFVMNLSKKAYCLLFVPVGLELKLSVKDGIINLKNMQQNFSIEMERGIVAWKQDDPTGFFLQELTASDVVGSREMFSKHGQWMAKINIGQGEVRLR
jgi:hypothetical protein